jgi:hypothetical protein
MWFFGLNGLTFIAVGLGFAVYTGAFIFRASETQGRVTDLQQKTDDENGLVNFYPVFTFVSQDRQTHTVTSNAGSNPPGFAIGDRVPVLYRSADPEGAKIKSFGQLWGLAIGLCIAGSITGTIGFLFYLWLKKIDRKAALPRYEPLPTYPL